MLHTGLSLVPRAIASVCQVVITIFRQCDVYTTLSYADSESDIENFEFEKYPSRQTENEATDLRKLTGRSMLRRRRARQDSIRL